MTITPTQSRLVQQARLGGAGLTAVLERVLDEAGAFTRLEVRDRHDGVVLDMDLGDMTGAAEWDLAGRRLAYIGNDADGTAQLYLFDSERPHHSVQVTHLPRGVDAGHLDWAPDGFSVLVTAPTGSTRDPVAPYRVTRRLWRMDGQGLIDDGRNDICVVDVDGTLRWLDLGGPAPVSVPRWSPNGRSVCYLAHFIDSADWSPCPALRVWAASDGNVTELTDSSWGWIDATLWAADSETVLVVGSPIPAVGGGFTTPAGVWAMSFDQRRHLTPWLPGGAGSRLAADTGISWPAAAGNLRLLHDSHTLLFTAEEAGRTYLASVDTVRGVPAEYAVRSDSASYALLDLRHTGEDPDGVVLLESSLETRPRLLHKTLADIAPDPEDAVHPTPRPRRASTGCYRHYRVPSADGYLVDTWVVLPEAGTAPFPTVLKVHGGPEASIGDVYGGDVAALAARGIAVVCHNFRGSYGYTAEQADLIRRDWGIEGESDHHSVLDHLIDVGVADPQRLGVLGHSHGGFATCWLIGRSHRFAAAVSENPVTNFHDIFYTADIGPWLYSREFDTTAGSPPDGLLRRSPITAAAQCTTPTLLIQGEQDLRCPPAQTDQMYAALWEAGCQVEMLRLPASSHSTSYSGSYGYRGHRINAVVDWFTQHLTQGPGRTEKPAAAPPPQGDVGRRRRSHSTHGGTTRAGTSRL